MFKLKILEEENFKLFSRNKALEEELLKASLNMNGEKCSIIKEKELMV